MLTFGGLLLVGGIISLIYGIIQNNSSTAQLKSFLSSGSVNPGTVFIVIGVIAIVLGLGLILSSQSQNQSSDSKDNSQEPKQNQDSNGWVCPNCAQLNSFMFNTCSCGTPRPRRTNQPSQNQPSQQIIQPQPQEWVCPNCSRIHSVDVKTCFYCNTPISEGTMIKPNLNAVISKSEWRCPTCGRINANYVGTCGCGQVKP